MCISHTIKNIFFFSKDQLNLINKEMDMMAEMVAKNFSDYLDDSIEDNIEKTNRSKVINQESTFFLRNESN